MDSSTPHYVTTMSNIMCTTRFLLRLLLESLLSTYWDKDFYPGYFPDSSQIFHFFFLSFFFNFSFYFLFIFSIFFFVRRVRLIKSCGYSQIKAFADVAMCILGPSYHFSHSFERVRTQLER